MKIKIQKYISNNLPFIFGFILPILLTFYMDIEILMGVIYSLFFGVIGIFVFIKRQEELVIEFCMGTVVFLLLFIMVGIIFALIWV